MRATTKETATKQRLAAAREWCRDSDPLARGRGLELAARLGRPGQDLIWAALEDRDAATRQAAIRLAARRVPAARLLDGVANPANSVLRTACIDALKLKGPSAIPVLRRGTVSEDPDVVLFTLQILGAMPEEDVAPILLGFLSHPDLNIAQAAVESLGDLKCRKAVGPLLELLEGDLWLRFAAILALGRIGDARATLELLKLTGDDSLGTTALEAIGRIGDPSAIEPLCRELVREDRFPQRDAILTAIGECLARAGGEVPRLRDPEAAAALRRDPFRRYLREGLASETPELRAAANRLVAAYGDETLYPGLVEHLDEPALASGTVSFLGSLPEAKGARELLQAAASHPRPAVRSAALRVLGLRSEAWGDAIIAEKLTDADPGVLANAVRSLARRLPEGAFEKVLPLLFHAREEVRNRALESLPYLARPTDVALLERLLLETEPGERLLAYVEVSRRLERGPFVGAWLSRIPGAPPDLLRGLLRALSEETGPEVTASLRPLLDHPEPAIRTLVIECLAHPANAAEIGPLLKARLRADPECVYYVVRALGRLRYAAAAGDLMAFYPSAAPLEKVAIVEAVGALGTPEGARFLEAELQGRDRERRRAAAAALAKHHRDGRLATFARLARAEDWSLRNTAAWALGEIGSDDAVPVLRKLTADHEEVVARTARNALEKLGS
ncbi:MAG: HEAT repeat domain-containing protein [Thermoanaerobaculia bacterium]